MKLKDFFTKIGEHIKTEEFTKFVENVPDADIDDSVMADFEGAYLTRERAVADKDVLNRIRPQLLDPIDRDIKNMLQALGHENAHEVEKEKDTYKKIAIVSREIPNALQRASKPAEGGEDFKKKIAQKDEAINDLTKKIESINSEWTQKEAELKSGFESKLHDIHLNSELDKISGNYTFADAYEKTRGTLQSAILGELKQSNKLQLSEKDGKADILVLDENGSPRFNGNSPVTIKSLLDEAYKPFLKQSNADNNGQQQQSQATPQRFPVQNPPNGTNMPRRNTG